MLLSAVPLHTTFALVYPKSPPSFDPGGSRGGPENSVTYRKKPSAFITTTVVPSPGSPRRVCQVVAGWWSLSSAARISFDVIIFLIRKQKIVGRVPLPSELERSSTLAGWITLSLKKRREHHSQFSWWFVADLFAPELDGWALGLIFPRPGCGQCRIVKPPIVSRQGLPSSKTLDDGKVECCQFPTWQTGRVAQRPYRHP